MYGIPDSLLTDQGRNVDGECIREMCAKFGIDKKHSSAYHPQGDGQAERAIENVKQAVRSFFAEHKLDKTNWPGVLQELFFNINSLKSSATKFTPHELMFGIKLRIPMDQIVRDLKNTSIDDPKSSQMGRESKGSDREYSLRQGPIQRYYDRNAMDKPKYFSTGQNIFLRNFTRGDGLAPTYMEPYTVHDMKYPNVKIRRGSRYSWFHLNDCKVVPKFTTEALHSLEGMMNRNLNKSTQNGRGQHRLVIQSLSHN